jgi:hypothetical protein
MTRMRMIVMTAMARIMSKCLMPGIDVINITITNIINKIRSTRKTKMRKRRKKECWQSMKKKAALIHKNSYMIIIRSIVSAYINKINRFSPTRMT